MRCLKQLRDLFQKAAHNFPAPCFRQRFRESNLVWLRDGADMNPDVLTQFRFQRIAHSHPAFHGDERDHALALQFIRPADHRRLGDIRVAH